MKIIYLIPLLPLFLTLNAQNIQQDKFERANTEIITTKPTLKTQKQTQAITLTPPPTTTPTKTEQTTTTIAPATTPVPTTPPANAPIRPRKMTISEATIKAINSARAQKQICSNPVAPLRWNPQLYKYAKEHTIDMAVTNKLGHDGSGTKTDVTAKILQLNRGSHFYERVNQSTTKKTIRSGELVIRSDIYSLRTPKELIAYWVKIPNDCKVIMDPNFTDVALSKVIDNKHKKAYWTLLLAGNRK